MQLTSSCMTCYSLLLPMPTDSTPVHHIHPRVPSDVVHVMCGRCPSSPPPPSLPIIIHSPIPPTILVPHPVLSFTVCSAIIPPPPRVLHPSPFASLHLPPRPPLPPAPHPPPTLLRSPCEWSWRRLPSTCFPLPARPLVRPAACGPGPATLACPAGTTTCWQTRSETQHMMGPSGALLLLGHERAGG